jgi:hypothetical protein
MQFERAPHAAACLAKRQAGMPVLQQLVGELLAGCSRSLTLFRGEFLGGAFPVGLADGIDGAGEGDANHEVGVDAVTRNGTGAAFGGFANDGSAFQVLRL